MERGGEGVVGTLRTVDVVVGVQEFLSRYLVAAIGDDLVKIHIGLGAAPRLPYGKREFVAQLSVKYLVRYANDELRTLLYKKEYKKIKPRLKQMGISDTFLPNFK